MNKNQELERGIIPAGTRIKLYEGRVTLLEDVAVDANQEWIDKAIKDQEDYFNGIGVVCCPKPETALSGKTGGALMGAAVETALQQGVDGRDSSEVFGCSFPQIQPLTRNAKLRLTLALIGSGITNPDDLISDINKIESGIFSK